MYGCMENEQLLGNAAENTYHKVCHFQTPALRVANAHPHVPDMSYKLLEHEAGGHAVQGTRSDRTP